MAFWQTNSGKALTGSTEDSFNEGFSPITDGTITSAMIKSFELKESDEYGTKYSIRWKIVDGEFKNREVSQGLGVFDNDADKRDKALNMMMRIYKLCDIKPGHNNAPTNNDLAPFQGKICTIKISLMVKKTGEKINFVSEVHESSYDHKEESALTRYRNSTHQSLESEDVPF